MSVDVIAFSPHPDDAEMGCGGLLLKLKTYGYSTAIVDVTKAELSTNGDIETRKEETRKASEILKLDLRLNLGLADCNIEISKENILKVIGVLRLYGPSVVIMPYGKDRHPDHENTHKLVNDSIFFSGLPRYPAGGKPHRPYAVLKYMLNYRFEPDFIVDISDYYHLKMKAYRTYRSQFFTARTGRTDDPAADHAVSQGEPTFINSRNFRQTIYSRDRYYGLKIRAGFGEPYFIGESIKIDDPLKFFKYLGNRD
jgi:N-acetylglucosamine malate deacetylase 1